LTAFKGYAVHTWRLWVPSCPSQAKGNRELSSGGGPQTWSCAWTASWWCNWR
jgi:hypothetical protein